MFCTGCTCCLDCKGLMETRGAFAAFGDWGLSYMSHPSSGSPRASSPQSHTQGLHPAPKKAADTSELNMLLLMSRSRAGAAVGGREQWEAVSSWDLHLYLATETLSAKACACTTGASLTPVQLPLGASEHQQVWRRGTEHFSQRMEILAALGVQIFSAAHVSRARSTRFW